MTLVCFAIDSAQEIVAYLTTLDLLCAEIMHLAARRPNEPYFSYSYYPIGKF